MMKRVVIVLLLLQAGAVLALAGALYAWWLPARLAAPGAPAKALLSVVLGMALVLLVRLLFSANNFLLSWLAGSATPAMHALNPASAIRLFLYEFYSSMRASSYEMLRPLGLQLQPPSPSQLCTLPVLLLHGYACNSGFWRPLSAQLRQAGISHYAIDLEPLGAAIDELVPQVHAAVERLCTAAGSAQVVIVAHSMGGLVARAYLRAHGAGRVARVVTLGTPHDGTVMAHLGLGRNAAQMRRGSAWLYALAQSDVDLQRGLFTSIYSVHDNIVAPQQSCILPGARNLAFGAVGHVALGRHPQILRCVLEEIALAAAAPSVPRSGTL